MTKRTAPDWTTGTHFGNASPNQATPNHRLAFRRNLANFAAVWDQPYLETCCRAALHRLHLSGPAGRPPGLMDDPCQRRLAGMGLCQMRPDGRFTITDAGRQRHAAEILKSHTDPATPL